MTREGGMISLRERARKLRALADAASREAYDAEYKLSVVEALTSSPIPGTTIPCRILEVCRRHPDLEFGVAELASVTRGQVDAVRRALQRMCARGEIEHRSHGAYAFPAARAELER